MGLPSESRGSSMLTAHNIDAMSMNIELFATFMPRQIRRPKPLVSVNTLDKEYTCF